MRLKTALHTPDAVPSLVEGFAVSPAFGKVIVILGPTASGKSALAEAVASVLDGEIVSADSMQVYRGMDIGTAKVPQEQRKVSYHCLDLVDPGQQFSVAVYQAAARSAMDDIQSRGKVAVMCGGTGLYIQAALDDMTFPKGDQGENPVREEYSKLAETIGAEALHELLMQRDPDSAALIHPHNVRRVVRAFEMLADGTSYAQQHEGLKRLDPVYEAVYIGLSVPTEVLNHRIGLRVDAMLEEGLFEEVQALLASGFRTGMTSPQAIGYKELVPLIDAGLGKGSKEYLEAAASIKQATRRYAKRQRTWFRREGRIKWIDAGGTTVESQLKDVLTMLESNHEQHS